MTDAMSRQIGGDHYSKQRIQPFEFTMANGWDACAHTILKYVHRHADKGGAQDLDKAIHTAEIRFTLLRRYVEPVKYRFWRWLNGRSFEKDGPYEPRIHIRDYIRENDIETAEALALHALEQWVKFDATSAEFVYTYRALLDRIKDLKIQRYGEPA